MVATITPTQVLTFSRSIDTSVEQVWQSFVNRDDICDWLCYNALLDPTEGGHIFLTWYDGQHAQRHASGVVLAVEENQKLVFTWNDAHYDQRTKVKVLLEEKDDSVTVTLHHKGFDESTPLEIIQHYQDFWDYHLDDLQSILETGGRASIMNRVIVGIYPTQLSEEVAKKLGIEPDGGVRVGSTVTGYSAEAAGIQSDDVIIALDGQALGNGTTMATITGDRKPGDMVSVTFYREGEKQTVDVTLKGYPTPEVANNGAELAEQQGISHAQLNQRLDEVLNGVSEDAAEVRLSDDNDNTKETLAYLILQHRHTLQYLASYAQGPRIITPFAYNRPWVEAVVGAYGTVSALRDELKRVQAEIVQMAGSFKDSFFERKNHVWWMTFELQGLPTAYDARVTQIQKTLEAYH